MPTILKAELNADERAARDNQSAGIVYHVDHPRNEVATGNEAQAERQAGRTTCNASVARDKDKNSVYGAWLCPKKSQGKLRYPLCQPAQNERHVAKKKNDSEDRDTAPASPSFSQEAAPGANELKDSFRDRLAKF